MVNDAIKGVFLLECVSGPWQIHINSMQCHIYLDESRAP